MSSAVSPTFGEWLEKSWHYWFFEQRRQYASRVFFNEIEKNLQVISGAICKEVM
jgi:hypothetical protein